MLRVARRSLALSARHASSGPGKPNAPNPPTSKTPASPSPTTTTPTSTSTSTSTSTKIHPPPSSSSSGMMIPFLLFTTLLAGVGGAAYIVSDESSAPDFIKLQKKHIPQPVADLLRPLGDVMTGAANKKKKPAEPPAAPVMRPQEEAEKAAAAAAAKKKAEEEVEAARKKEVLEKQRIEDEKKKEEKKRQDAAELAELQEILARASPLVEAEDKLAAEKAERANSAAGIAEKSVSSLSSTGDSIAADADLKINTLGVDFTPELAEIPQVAAERAAADRSVAAGVVRDVALDIKKRSAAMKEEVEKAVVKYLQSPSDDKKAQKAHLDRVIELTAAVSRQNRQAEMAMEQALEEKHRDLVTAQREQLALSAAELLVDLERAAFETATRQAQALTAQYEQRFLDAMNAQAQGFHAAMTEKLKKNEETLTAELTTQKDEQLRAVQSSHEAVVAAIEPAIAGFTYTAQKVDAMVGALSSRQQTRNDEHRISAAILCLETLLSSSGRVKRAGPEPAQQQLRTLQDLWKQSALAHAVLESLPKRALKEGAYSLPELQARFAVMRDEVRKVALAPDVAPNKFLNQLIGNFLAAVSLSPKGYVTGQGLEEALARAAWFVDRGKLADALRELDTGVAKGAYSRKLMQDWRDCATERLVIDQGMQLLKAEALLLHKT